MRDPLLIDRLLREFMVNAETREQAIFKHSSGTAKPKEAEPNHVKNPIPLTIENVEELYDIWDYNYAIHGEVLELYNDEEESE